MTTHSKQKGVFLIEALMGILIFSLGILSLVAIQTASISAQSDAQYRIEAANLAHQMLSQIWLGVDRTSSTSITPPPGTVISTSLTAFQHQSGGSNCNFSGAASTNTNVTNWVSAVTGGANSVTPPTGAVPLPGATTAMQQILISTANNNRITLTLCWKAPLDAGPRKHTVVTYVN